MMTLTIPPEAAKMYTVYFERHHRRNAAAAEHAPDRAVRRQQMVLTDHAIEGVGPHPVGQRPRRQGVEQRT